MFNFLVNEEKVLEKEDLQDMIENCVETEPVEELPNEILERQRDYQAKFESNSDSMQAAFENPNEEVNALKDT